MSRIRVSEKALRELVNEALDGVRLDDMPAEEISAVNINNIVDPSAPVTNPINPNFVPHTKPELDVAIKQLTKDVSIEKVPDTYKSIRDVINADKKEEEDEEMTKADKPNKTNVEESIRLAVRKILAESPPLPPVKKIPMGVHGGEYMRRMQKVRDDLAKTFGKTKSVVDDEEESPESSEPSEPGRRGAYKATAIGGMSDVGGKSFQEIADELGFSVAGAKRAVDTALEKAKWMATEVDPDELEILVLSSMNDYISLLNKTGELSPADVQLMKDHPDIVRELDGFREFLDKAIKRARREDQHVEDPIGESTDHDRTVQEALDKFGKGK